MIFPRVHISVIFQIFLIFALISSASAKGKSTTKTTQKAKPTKDNSLKSCVYQTPPGFSNDSVATKSKYTVTVTAGITVSTSVYDSCCFLENPPKECSSEQCHGACTEKPKNGKKSSAKRGVENSERVWDSGILTAMMSF
ncbi:hypothetical protein BOTNAR_0088g00300 [Botryotinia narcissicola]|uniref:Uncharacterized protein n=1 Tax=Botryotinia narcissicola TaxID=278944 RepID=A0A4Z1IYM2_9HELO|nr:hypothetical protein BOTNAR_0088g00300 [Botryotinia narcissicola]